MTRQVRSSPRVRLSPGGTNLRCATQRSGSWLSEVQVTTNRWRCSKNMKLNDSQLSATRVFLWVLLFPSCTEVRETFDCGFLPHRPDLRHLAVLRGGGVELERMADPRPLGVSLPNPRKHPPVAAGRLHLRLHLHH